MMLAMLAMLPSLAPAQGFPARLTVDALKEAEPRDLLVSDDGRMVFNFGGQGRRAYVPNGPLIVGDAIKSPKGKPLDRYTDSQIARLDDGRGLVRDASPRLASPAPNQVLLGGDRITLMLYKARGKGANPSLPMGCLPSVRPTRSGAYLAACGDPDGKTLSIYRIDTSGGRLRAKRVSGPLRARIAPPPPGASQAENPAARARAWDDDPLVATRPVGGGRFAIDEWRPGTRAWRTFAPPVEQRSHLGGMTSPPPARPHRGRTTLRDAL